MTRAILIVDDSLTVRADLEEAFADAGMPTISCASAMAARMALATQPVGLVILDVLLPDGDGIELLREFRATTMGADLPVLMLSTEAEVKDRIRGLLTGSSDYVGKPYEREYVVARAAQLLDDAARAKTQDRPAPHSRSVRPTVLVIDDSTTFRERFSELLQEQGFDVINAASGEEGLRSAAANRPAAIVVDGILPGIDGQTVVRKIRLDAALRHTPCILLTGSESYGAELHALDSGADAFVRKEESLDMMLARVTAVLRKIDKVEARHATASLQSPKKILAVDDSMTYLHELNSTLGGEGYDVILAHSGQEALDMLSVQTVDCILLDRLMPGLDGTETCRRIKASPATRDIPLIMLTAMEDQEAMIEGLSTGADDYVLKSHELDVLKARVRAQLRRKQFEEDSRRIRMEMMNKELEASETRAARALAESRAELLAVLEQKNQDLERAIAQLRDRQQEIAEKNLQLEQANRLKSEFLSHMSHEIRTPMNAILGFAYLLDQRHLAGDTGDMIRKIRSGGQTLQSIINDILDFSKIEAGHLEIEHAPFRISTTLDELSDIMAANAGHKDLELILAPPPELGGQLFGDALRLEQILINLTGNAIKFSDHGVVKVEISLLEQTEHTATLRFSVSDTGIGISLDKQSQIFAAFTQADASTTRRFGGSGLGLSICRHLVEQMGGEIGVISEPGRGSEFWFSIPFEWSANSEFSAPEMMTLNALIVDDNDMALENLELTAQSMGWNVVKALSGEEAIEKVRSKQEGGGNFDVFLLDWNMPGMDGLSAAIKIREMLRQEAAPIVLMVTAFSREELLRQTRIDAIDGILCKPVTRSTLHNNVTEALNRRSHESASGLRMQAQKKKRRRLPGVRVLIVDDNEINREVAMLVVSAEGAVVQLANDGKNALDWLLANPDAIDIVLMDVQMPIMDGYETTRQLRTLPALAQLPVVALTAGAFKAQQDAALNAGMNAFVSKPFNVEELIATIQQLTHCHSEQPEQPESAAPEQPEASPLAEEAPFDDRKFPGIAVNHGLKVWGDVALYRKYLLKFCSDFAEYDKQLSSHAADDQKALGKWLHKLKGVAGNLSLVDVVRLAAEVEAIEAIEDGSDGQEMRSRLHAAMEVAFASIALFAADTESGAIAADNK
ncbi:signal transduction histidine kinase [Herbaspirillum sp. CF444]|uniref:response regulator n=1 Tax=Herbaspirillum sp. CF444 TaxID=1144319 RepID=UPI00027283B0|nr:response regulator [Herbaspirillum sp. CF444]EJL90868.1 signal transduction histidine kinase [Herbaspirillum sp. CF444]